MLECQTSEMSVTITWYRIDNTPISPSGDGKYTQFMNGSLQIASFVNDDNGRYYCVAENSAGSVRSQDAQLQIACKDSKVFDN